MSGRSLGSRSGGFVCTLAAIALACVLPLGTAWGEPAAPPAEVLTQYRATFDPGGLVFDQVEGYDVVRLPGLAYLQDVGQPMLPIQQLRFALPPGTRATAIRVRAVESVRVAGQYQILPAQPALPVGATPSDFVPPDAETYACAVEYPGALVTLVDQGDLAGQPIATVELHPVGYTPASGALTLYTHIDFVIEGVRGYVCGDYLSPNASPAVEARVARTVTRIVANPAEVTLARGTAPTSRLDLPDGTYEYVIITPAAWVNAFRPLADWKTRKGVPATIVTTEWIGTTYGDGTVDYNDIRSFVIDAHSQWQSVYFLLGGDIAYVPIYDASNPPNDTYYSDYDGDWFCEVHVGRAPVPSVTDVNRFVNKVLTYEQRPPLTNYLQKFGLFGFDLHDDGAEGESCKELIAQLASPFWSFYKVYDSYAVPPSHESVAIGYLNAGMHLVNHIDHSNYDCMGLGYIHHGATLNCAEVDALTNVDRRCILYSVGCSPAAMDEDPCIAEHFIRATGGAVAFIGNTRSGYYSPHNPSALSLLYDQYFFHSLFVDDVYHLGACFSDHKNDTTPVSQYIFKELTLLGDPEMPVWTATPTALTVRHSPAVPVGPSHFRVQVTAAAPGTSIDASVCLWKGAEIYEIQPVDASGYATFNIAPATAGTLYVTAFGRNLLPYRGTARVVAETWAAEPYDFDVEIGELALGGLEDLYSSNDWGLVIWPGLPGYRIPPNTAVLTVYGTSEILAPGEFSFTVEARVNRDNTIQTVKLYNFALGVYENASIQTATQSDSAVTVTGWNKTGNYINPATGEVRAQVKWVMSTSEPEGLVISVDQTLWHGAPPFGLEGGLQ